MFKDAETPAIVDYGSTYNAATSYSKPAEIYEEYAPAANPIPPRSSNPYGTSPPKFDSNGSSGSFTRSNRSSTSPVKPEMPGTGSFRTFGGISKSPSNTDLNGANNSYSSFGNTSPNNISSSGSFRTFGSSNISPAKSSSSRNLNASNGAPALDLNGGNGSYGSLNNSSSSFTRQDSARSSQRLSKEYERDRWRPDDDEGGDMTVKMINPVVSPLSGTKITMEMSRPLPLNTKVKVGGKSAAAQVNDSNPKIITFMSPALPAGVTNIEIITGYGESTVLDGILLYETMTPQYSSDTYTKTETVRSSSRVWGKKN